MWLILAFLSAALLGFYDSFKKKALHDNAVIPVLFLNCFAASCIAGAGPPGPYTLIAAMASIEK